MPIFTGVAEPYWLLAGMRRMPVERIRPGQLCALLIRYPKARFVLMHNAYSAELIAIAKHYPNV